MFNLPHNNNPEELLRLFDFKYNVYEVCFDIVEKRLWFFGGRVEKVKRYYIASTSRLSPDDGKEYLTYYSTKLQHFKYSFVTQSTLNSPDTSKKVLHWDNPTDPIDLLTFLKGRLDRASQKDFVVFSSKELE